MTDIYEDKVLSEIFACSLDASRANATANPPVVHLEGLAEVTAHNMFPFIGSYPSSDHRDRVGLRAFSCIQSQLGRVHLCTCRAFYRIRYHLTAIVARVAPPFPGRVSIGPSAVGHAPCFWF